MRPEIKKLLDIARQQEWKICYDPESVEFLSVRDSLFPKIYFWGVRINSISRVDFLPEEMIEFDLIFSDINVRNEQQRQQIAWEHLLDYLK